MTDRAVKYFQHDVCLWPAPVSVVGQCGMGLRENVSRVTDFRSSNLHSPLFSTWYCFTPGLQVSYGVLGSYDYLSHLFCSNDIFLVVAVAAKFSCVILAYRYDTRKKLRENDKLMEMWPALPRRALEKTCAEE